MVGIQFIVLILIALTGPILARHPFFLALEIVALVLAGWAVLSVRIGNFNIVPDVRAGSQLVRSGPYQYIRHPMYASLMFLTWGEFIKQVSWPGAFLALASIFLWFTAKRDEEGSSAYFGADYRLYMQKTKRFIPFIL